LHIVNISKSIRA